MLGKTNKTGFSPQTALSEKLRSYGITDVNKLQGTTKRIFDTVTTNATSTEYQFFNENRSLPETNFQQRFGVGEAMILEELTLEYYQQDPLWNIELQPGFRVGANSQYDGYYTIRIGNTNVVENVPICGSAVQYLNTTQNSNTFFSPYKFVFNSLLVLPPDTDFTVILNINAPLFNEQEESKIRFSLTGTAVELNAKF